MEIKATTQMVRGIFYSASDDAKTSYVAKAILYQKYLREKASTDKILRTMIDAVKNEGKCSIRSETEFLVSPIRLHAK